MQSPAIRVLVIEAISVIGAAIGLMVYFQDLESFVMLGWFSFQPLGIVLIVGLLPASVFALIPIERSSESKGLKRGITILSALATALFLGGVTGYLFGEATMGI